MAFLAVDDFLQSHVLPDALPGPGRHAPADSRLRDAVCRLQHDRVDRRVRFWPVAAPVRVGRREMRAGCRRKSAGQAVGRRGYARMDVELAAAVSQFRDTAGRQVMSTAMAQEHPGKYRTALILAAIAALFFLAVIVRHWLW